MKHVLHTYLLAGLLLAFSHGAAAQLVEDNAELQAAFEAMIADPDNVGLAIEYASLATELGDYETAIGALERILIISPDLPTVRADLGVLYFRLHSYPMARQHLQRALASGRLSPGQTQRAQRILAALDDTGERHAFGGRITAGFRYQSNANSGPDSDVVRAAGLDVVLDDDFRERDDGDFFAISRLTHSYDFKRQNYFSWDSDAFLFVNRQFDVDDIDALTVEVTTGPRWQPLPVQWKGLSVRPHLVANYVMRGDDRLSNVYGAGVDVVYANERRYRITGQFQHRQRDFNQTAERPFLNEREGHENYLAVDARYLLRPNMTLYGRLDVLDRAASADFNDSLEIGALARLDYAYDSPFGLLPGRWRAYVTGGYRSVDYDAPNARVDPLVARNDDVWRFSVGNAFPITGRWQANAEVSGLFADSNLPNFERENISASINLTYWF